MINDCDSLDEYQKQPSLFYIHKCFSYTPDTLGLLPDIAANARPLRAWLKCRTITTHARESVADLSRNCKGFLARESEHARVTESRTQGTGIGRDIRQSPSRVRSVFLLIYGFSFSYLLQKVRCLAQGAPCSLSGPLHKIIPCCPPMSCYDLQWGSCSSKESCVCMPRRYTVDSIF